MTSPRTRRIGTVLVALGFAFIAVLTLRPNPGGVRNAELTPFTCLVCGEQGGVDVILNVLLFLPLGAGLGLRGVSDRRALILVLATTATVETLQGFFILGRDASISDLLTNTLGGALGIILGRQWKDLVYPGAAASRRLAFGGLAAWLLLWSASAALLQPTPPAPAWWAQLAPTGVTRADYPGRVLSVAVNGRELPDGKISDPAGLLPGSTVDSARVEVTAVAARTTPRLASIFSIFSGRQEEALMVAQVGHSLLLRSRRRAANFLLQNPALGLHGAAGNPGDTIHFRGVVRQGSLAIRVDGRGVTDSNALRITPSLGWAMILPFEVGLGPLAAKISWLWILALLLPIGYWGRRADRLGAPGRRSWWATLAVALPFGLWGVPAVAQIAAASPQDLVAALAALALGAAAGSGVD